MSTFSKRHYEAISAVLRVESERFEKANLYRAIPFKNTIIHALADLFARDNPAFNRDRFLKASGINPNSKRSEGIESDE